MKKIIALSLAVCMLAAALTGCGTKDSTTGNDRPPQTNTQQDQQQKPSEQENKEVAAGTVLDAPEVVFDTNTEDLYVYFTYPGDAEDEVLSMEITVDQVTTDTYLIYVTDGLIKNHELVYEVTDVGVTKYYKDIFMSEFALETEASQEDLEKEKNNILSLLSYFIMQHSDYAGCQYRKSDALVVSLTGDVYVYDMLENNECVGQISIDKSTGLVVNIADAQGNAMYTVHKFQISNVEIPAYK